MIPRRGKTGDFKGGGGKSWGCSLQGFSRVFDPEATHCTTSVQAVQLAEVDLAGKQVSSLLWASLGVNDISFGVFESSVVMIASIQTEDAMAHQAWMQAH